MKFKKLFKLAPVAAAIGALGFGMVGNAQAASTYALSTNNINHLVITLPPTTTLASANFTVDTSANLNGTGVGPQTGVTDAPFSQVGSAGGYVENSFVPFGQSGNYALGDAFLPVTALNPGAPPTPTGNSFTQARNLAESNLTADGTGFATAGNQSVTTANFSFTSQVAGPLSLAFDATTFLQAFVSTDALFPSDARAELSVNFKLTDSLGATVYDWSPNGNADAGGPFVGVGIASETDPFTLNTSVSRDQSLDGNAFGTNNSVTGVFASTSIPFAAGTYQLQLVMRETVSTRLNVPEPEVLALLGTGLVSFGFMKRRRKSASTAKIMA